MNERKALESLSNQDENELFKQLEQILEARRKVGGEYFARQARAICGAIAIKEVIAEKGLDEVLQSHNLIQSIKNHKYN